MFNPEKILGGLLRSGMRRGGGLGGLVPGGAALGLIGVAMGAVEHFMNKPGAGGGSPPRSAAPSGGAMPPAGNAPPPPPPAPGAIDEGGRQEAVLLIRAMIAAANADGVIDAKERARILEQLQSVSLSKEDHAFIVHELLSPRGLDDIVREVTTRELAEQVYRVSLLAIEVDTQAEREYLDTLAKRVGLTPDVTEKLKTDVESWF